MYAPPYLTQRTSVSVCAYLCVCGGGGCICGYLGLCARVCVWRPEDNSGEESFLTHHPPLGGYRLSYWPEADQLG